MERIELANKMFNHWLINDRLIELGWKKHQIPFFKKGMVDSLEGNWNDNIINYSYDYGGWYCDMLPEPTYPPDPEFKYHDPKMIPGPATYKEIAYTAGYEAGEEFIKQWSRTNLNIMWDTVSGD